MREPENGGVASDAPGMGEWGNGRMGAAAPTGGENAGRLPRAYSPIPPFSHSPIPPLSRERGVTLVEMTLVLMVLILACGAVAPQFIAYRRAQSVRTAALRLAALARYGEEWSVVHGRSLLLAYDPEARRFSLEIEEEAAQQVLADPAAEKETEQAEEPQLDEGRSVLRLHDDVEVVASEMGQGENTTSSAEQVRFLADGRCDDAAFVLGREEARCTVRLEGRRGRVTVEAGDGLEPPEGAIADAR